jgi:hypothetical protein
MIEIEVEMDVDVLAAEGARTSVSLFPVGTFSSSHVKVCLSEASFEESLHLYIGFYNLLPPFYLSGWEIANWMNISCRKLLLGYRTTITV